MRSRITGTSSTLMPAVGSSNMKTSRLERHQDRHFELALVAVRQSAAAGASRCRRGWPRAMKCVGLLDPARVGCSSARARSSAAAGARLHGEAHVLEHGEVGEQIGELERAADAARRARAAPQPRDVLAVEQHRAGGRRQLARDQVEVGGLAGAVRADDRGERARRGRRSSRASTATWPPKRIVRSRVSRTGWLRHRRCAAMPGCGCARVPAAAQRLLRIGTGISSAGISRTSSSRSHSSFCVLLDPEVVHVLHRLMVFLAEGHLALGRVEAHAFHGRDQLLGVGAAGLLERWRPPRTPPRCRPR